MNARSNDFNLSEYLQRFVTQKQSVSIVCVISKHRYF